MTERRTHRCDGLAGDGKIVIKERTDSDWRLVRIERKVPYSGGYYEVLIRNLPNATCPCCEVKLEATTL
jgi:hypothetical protein